MSPTPMTVMGSTDDFAVPSVETIPEADALREAVREFLAGEAARGAWVPRCDHWLTGHDPAFSRRLAAKGWVGMTWPPAYGGQGRSSLERFVVTEELLVAGAPVAAHWAGDRQIGPALLRLGTGEQKDRFLPAMASGECFWALGMSEPDAGSDLAAVRTRARPSGDAWRLTGQKTWTSGAHLADYAMVLCRTEPSSEGDRHHGLTQLIVDLRSPGVDVRPIRLMSGEPHFNDVFFDDVAVPAENVLGVPGEGWRQVTAELAHERSGPERFLSTFPLLQEIVAVADATTSEARVIGELVAELWTLHHLASGVAALLASGSAPEVQAALVKDLGTQFEHRVIEQGRRVVAMASDDQLFSRYIEGLLHAPGFTIRGGTTEILRGVIARALGLR